MKLILLGLVCVLVQLAHCSVLYEADLRDFQAGDYSSIVPNPTSIKVKSIKKGHNHGIEARLDPFVDNGLPMPFGHFQFLFGSPSPLSVSTTPFFRAYWKLSARLDVSWDKKHAPLWGAGVSHKKDDPRLGRAVTMLVDRSTGIVAEFILTNHGIWAFYERVGTAIPALGPYSTFAQIRRIASRAPEDVHELSIEYDGPSNTITWFIGLEAVASVGQLGLMTTDPRWKRAYVSNTGEPKEESPRAFVVAFGCLYAMDHADPWRENSVGLISASGADSSSYLYPTSWLSQSYDNSADTFSPRLYGQGISLKVFEMEAHAHSH